jgi:hypothetical protein
LPAKRFTWINIWLEWKPETAYANCKLKIVLNKIWVCQLYLFISLPCPFLQYFYLHIPSLTEMGLCRDICIISNLAELESNSFNGEVMSSLHNPQPGVPGLFFFTTNPWKTWITIKETTRWLKILRPKQFIYWPNFVTRRWWRWKCV